MSIPADNLNRQLIVADADDPSAVHISLVGNTYTILVSGEDTEGRYSLIDMFVPPGGGPPAHRHDFEESFTVLEGEIEALTPKRRAMQGIGQAATQRSPAYGSSPIDPTKPATFGHCRGLLPFLRLRSEAD